MNSYLFSSSGFINVAEDSDSLDDISVLDVTTSPKRFLESHEKLRKFSENLFDSVNRENSQQLLDTSLTTSENSFDIFDRTDDIRETPKSIEIIDLTSPEKPKQNRSPLLPTQPPSTTCSIGTKQWSTACCNGTLDSWINILPPKPVKYALNLTPDVFPEKLRPVTKAGKHNSKNRQIAARSWSSSDSNSIELKSTSDITECQDENIREYPQIPQTFSQSITNQKLGEITESLNSSVLGSTQLIISQGGANGSDQLDIISSSDDSSFPPTPSPPKTLRKSVTLKQVPLTTVLNRSNVATCCTAQESPHMRSLIKAISSPTFHQNGQQCRDNELTSRFNDDGKVRRKKAERRLLHGFDCRCCEEYYEALGLNHDERNKRIDQVSKHRDVAKEPSTPEYYWEIGMPNIEERHRRGQIIESNSPLPLKTRYPECNRTERARRRLFF